MGATTSSLLAVVKRALILSMKLDVAKQYASMDEKFNKGEAWGDLSKSKKALEDGGESQDEYDFGALPCDDTKNVYVKDDFFDSLSCDALDRGSKMGGPSSRTIENGY